MTREEQIEQKVKELGQKYFPDECNVWARPNYEAQYVESACKEMMEWADKEMEEHCASDRRMIEEIIINLKRVEQDYCIDLTKEMEWLRNIVKKENKNGTDRQIRISCGD